MTIAARVAALLPAASRPDGRALATLMAWFSPAFPTGAFAYSHGLEEAVAMGLVGREDELLAWLDGVLRYGGGWNDAVIMARACTAEPPELLELNELASALCASSERLNETRGQGEAFAIAVRQGWPDLLPADLPCRLCQPVAAGAAAGALGADPEAALIAYLSSFASNLIAVAIRLGVCGQSAGARLLAALGPVFTELAARAAAATLEDLGGCAFGSDIAAMRHETLDGRLFLS